MGRRPELTFLQRGHTDGQQAHEKMFNITSYQRNANQNYNIISHQTEWLSSKNPQTTNAGRECREMGALPHCWWECKLLHPLQRTVQRFLKKLKTELTYDPAIPFLVIHPEKNMAQKDICTSTFLQRCLQQPRHGNHFNVHRQRNR